MLEILEMNSEEVEMEMNILEKTDEDRIVTINKINGANLPQVFKDLSLVANFVMCSKD